MKYVSIKNSILLTFVIILAGLTGFLTSCVKQKFDQPPTTIPHVDFSSNATIDSLKRYWNLKPHAKLDTVQITDNLIIQGVINSTDASGNIYKSMYIQDATGGLCISVDQGGMSALYKLGQRVFIKCQGLYLGTYGGMIELGYKDYNGTSIGRMSYAMFQQHVFLDSLPKNYVAPVILDPKSSPATFANNVCMLVQVPKVMFTDTTVINNNPPPLYLRNTFVVNNTTTNHNICDSTGSAVTVDSKIFIIRTSNYADFSSDPLPEFAGTLRGILTVYNGQYQMVIRDRNDYTPWR